MTANASIFEGATPSMVQSDFAKQLLFSSAGATASERATPSGIIE